MPKPEPANSPWDSGTRLLAWLASCLSVLAFLFYYRQGEVLLYGDAIAHINIARRVFDSKTPGLLQLGTVWLPLPHLLMIPFLISKNMWQSGAGGSIPSMVAYVFGVIGVFRLTRGALSGGSGIERAEDIAAWAAALIYAANPNLIYMQSTAMGETLYLALFIWAVVYFSESLQGDGRALTKCGLCLAAACLTRYDGWFLAAAMIVAVVAIRATGPVPATSGKQDAAGSLRAKPARQTRVSGSDSIWTIPWGAVVKFVFIAAAAPILWLAYNGIVYGNPLEFENGPYSAKAIERKTQSEGNPGHPGSGNAILAARYFLKAAESNVAENDWLQRGWLLLAIVSVIAIASSGRATSPSRTSIGVWPLLFYGVPIAFYALSIAYGGVPIFVPRFWPFSHYNVRYGLHLLPALAVALGMLIYVVLRSETLQWRLRLACVLAVFAFVAISYGSIWHATPICLAEAQVNMRTRNQLQAELARWLERLPEDSTLLMYLGDQVGTLERAGIPLKCTINEGNHRVWKQPTDPEGLWERALANPSQYADYVLALEGDPVWAAVHGLRLRELVEIHVTGQPRAILYRAR